MMVNTIKRLGQACLPWLKWRVYELVAVNRGGGRLLGFGCVSVGFLARQRFRVDEELARGDGDE